MSNITKTMDVNEALAFARELYLDKKYSESEDVINNISQMLTEPSASELKIMFLLSTNQFDRVFREAENAISKNSISVDIYTTIGFFLVENSSYDLALEAYECLVNLKPNDANGWFNVAFLQLLNGDYRHGLAAYEWRLKSKQAPTIQLNIPKWSGEKLSKKRILVYEEQGVGDTFMFVRYLQWLKYLGATVVFQCRRQLSTLFINSPYIDELISNVNQEKHCHFYIPLISLPFLHRTRLSRIPYRDAYITPQQKDIDKWQSTLINKPNKKIGVVWAGNPNNKVDKKRSIPGSEFEPLLNNKAYIFYNLQVGEKCNEIITPRLIPISNQITDYNDTAAIIIHMDLIITVDTSVAHLAAAMGKPVWVLLPHVPTDWRWLLHRDDSPWYPTLRLFRQTVKNDWSNVISDVSKELLKL